MSSRASGPGLEVPLVGARHVLLGVLLAVLVGCGGDAGQAASTPAAPTDESSSVAPEDLEQYLLRADEVPGLTPVMAPRTESRAPFALPEDGAAIFERSGYISTTLQPAEGERSGGVSSVMLFGSEAGARDWMAYETSDAAILAQIPDPRIERFEVSGVPGASGWTGLDLHGNKIGHVFWTQGRCMMLIGLEVEGPRVEALSAGVRAIYERTGGTCPS
jgi:hypothetical protein